MKKVICLLMILALAVSLAACSAVNTAQTTTENVPKTTAPSDETNTDGGNGKTLVVYFSATGTTKSVAELIANTSGGDLYEIVPKTPYTSDDLNYRDDNSRVSREHDDPSLRTVELANATVPNWKEYDTVYIGYPIWWGEASWVVSSFAAANDFTGKTVIPFCTSASSGIGNSAANLAKTAGTGDWKEGKRFGSSADAQDIEDWLAELN